MEAPDSADGRLARSTSVTFADVAHQTLIFDARSAPDSLVLELLDTAWLQRLRTISQTGNTKLVYMFAEHSRFGHSLGVAYLACLLMKSMKRYAPELVTPFEEAVAAAALLHDVGHVAPGSHLAERVWAPGGACGHEAVTDRIIQEDQEIQGILNRRNPVLLKMVRDIITEGPELPNWTKAVISGGGWNADRGNWSIVDSAMCSVSYGRYNVLALLDAFRLTGDGNLVLQENRVDALTHFFVARDSMYRQVYQHRVLQAVDALTRNIVRRLRELLPAANGKQSAAETSRVLQEKNIFCDETMVQVLLTRDYSTELPLAAIFQMNEYWWYYHVSRWCSAADPILSDLAKRLRDRRLFKTIRLNQADSSSSQTLIERAKEASRALGLDPRYYVNVIDEKDKHRGKTEQPPMAALDSGEILPVTVIEPMIDQIMRRPSFTRTWLAVPREIKEKLGRSR